MAAKPRLLTGWSKAPKKGRYLTPLGVNVSARQYKNARANLLGLPSYSAFERSGKSLRYKRFAELYEQRHPGEKAGGLDSEFTRRYVQLTMTPEGKVISSEDISNAPGDPLATFLEFIGIRPSGATWPVGETGGEGSGY